MNRRQFLIFAVALSLAACGGIDIAPPQPTVPPTSLPTLTPLSHSAFTPTPESTLEQAPSTGTPTIPEPSAPQPADWQEFIFSEYSLIGVYYDPLVWMPDKGMGQGMLVHTAVPGCQISDKPTSEPPPNMELGNLGPFVVRSAQVDDPATGLRQVWLVIQSGLPAAYAESGVNPVILVSAPAADADRCLRDAVLVIANLHNSGVP